MEKSGNKKVVTIQTTRIAAMRMLSFLYSRVLLQGIEGGNRDAEFVVFKTMRWFFSWGIFVCSIPTLAALFFTIKDIHQHQEVMAALATLIIGVASFIWTFWCPKPVDSDVDISIKWAAWRIVCWWSGLAREIETCFITQGKNKMGSNLDRPFLEDIVGQKRSLNQQSTIDLVKQKFHTRLEFFSRRVLQAELGRGFLGLNKVKRRYNRLMFKLVYDFAKSCRLSPQGYGHYFSRNV